MAQSTAPAIATKPGLRAAGDGALAGPIDRQYLARFTMGNAALEQEVLELFAGQAPLYLADLRAAASRKAWKNAAHTIKGSAAAVGALRVSRLAELAERLDFDAPGFAANDRAQAEAALETAIEEATHFITRLFSPA